MTELAVIGIDATFAGHDSIDRVERAFYQGQVLTNELQGLGADLLSRTLDCATRLLGANCLSIKEVALVVVCQHDDTICSALSDQLRALGYQAAVFKNLGDAMVEVSELAAPSSLAVVLVGVNQTADVRNLGPCTISFDQSFTGYHQLAGAAGLLVATPGFSQAKRAYIYGVIKGVATGGDIAQVCSNALKRAALSANNIGLVDVTAAGEPQKRRDEMRGLIAAYGGQGLLQHGLSCARPIVGDSGGFAQVAGLLKTVLALHQRYIPALAHWQQPDEDQLSAWLDSSFYFPVDARPWFPNADGSAHSAAFSCHGDDGYCHIIVQEHLLGKDLVDKDLRLNGYFAASDLTLLILSGDSEEGLQQQLTALSASDDGLKVLAKRCYDRHRSAAAYHISLIAESPAELVKEIALAQVGINKAFAQAGEWKTPKGSYFSTNPAAKDNNGVAFLYPGIGATYVGLGRDLFHLFPQIYQPVAGLADDIGSSLKDTLLNPRSVVRHGFKELKQLDLELRGNLANIAEAGVGFACVFTKIFEQVFAVKADFATGYSMGEVSMYAALGCWQQPGLMSARLASSNTFNHQLCGELNTLRDHWDLPQVGHGTVEPIWETYTIKATIEQVKLATIDEPRVYCTIVNTHDNLLLAGYPADCLRVVKQLGVRAMALNMANAIHSAPAYGEYDHMVALYTMDVTPRINTKMYSSSCYLPIPQLSKAIAHSIAKCLCDVVDFPRLVTTLHDKGARVFIEMGPGRSLCAWVDKILAHQAKEQPIANHVAVPVNAKGTSDELTYLRALAKLVSHGVDVNLDSLFYGSIIAPIGDNQNNNATYKV